MMDKNLPDASRRQVLNIFILLSAVYLLMLTIFTVVALPTDASSWMGFYIVRGATGIGLLGGIWWQNQARRTWLATGAYLLLVAGGLPLFSPFQPLDQVMVVYAFGTFAASLVIVPLGSFLFASLSVVAYTTIYLVSHPTANYDYPAMAGLLGLAIAAWLVARITENVREKIRASLESHHAVLERFPIGLYQADKQWRILDANPAFIRMLGYPTIDSLLLEGNAPTYVDQRVRQEWHTRLDREGVGSIDTQWRRYDGVTLWVHENARAVHDEAGKIVGYEGSIEDIATRKRSDDELQRQADVMTILYETTQDVGANQQLPALVQMLVRRAVKLAGATYGSIYLYDLDRHGWEWRISPDSSEPNPPSPLAIDQEIVEQIILSRQPIAFGNHTPLPHPLNGRSKLQLGAIAAVPMLNDQELVGVLVVNRDDSIRQFTDQDVELLGQFAKHAASAVDNARHLEQTQQSADDLAVLSQASTNIQGHQDALEILTAACNELQKLGQFTFAFLKESDSSLKHVYTTMNATMSSEYQTAFGGGQPTFEISSDLVLTPWKRQSSGQVLRDPDFISRLATTLPSKSRSLADWLIKSARGNTTWLLPLNNAGEIIGVVVLGSYRASLSYAPMLSLFAQSISTAITASHLIKENNRSVTELGMLRRTASAWRTTQGPDQVAASLLDETLAVLGATDGALILFQSEQRDNASIVARGWFNTLGNLALQDNQSIIGHVITTSQLHISKEFVSDVFYLAPPPMHIESGWGGICVPIPGIHAARGAICIAVQHPRQITHEELRLIHTIAEFAGTAPVSLHVDTQTEKRLLLQLFQDTNKAIGASADFQSVVNLLIEQITKHLQVDAADVLILNPKTQLLEFVAGRGFRTHSLERAHLRVGEGLAGKVARQRVMVQISDLAQESSRFARTVLAGSEGFISYLGVPLLANGQVKGVVEIFNRAPIKFAPEELDFLNGILTRLAVAAEDTWFIRDIQQQHDQLAQAYDQTLMAWAQLLEVRGHEPPGHTHRVTDMTIRLANQMKLKDDVSTGLRRGALLHDIGKIGIPDAILFSLNPLSQEEWAIIRQHPQIAYDLLAPIAHLQDALDIPYCHHERWDGSGYPRGLRGEQIPLAARIFAVVDTWDALTSDRPYRPAWDASRTSAYIRSLAGSAFDFNVVETFIRMLAQPPSEPKLDHILIAAG